MQAFIVNYASFHRQAAPIADLRNERVSERRKDFEGSLEVLHKENFKTSPEVAECGVLPILFSDSDFDKNFDTEKYIDAKST